MIYRLYEHHLQSRIAKSNLPGCVAVVLSSGDLMGEGLLRLSQLLEWSRSIGLSSLVLYVNDDAPQLLRKISAQLAAAPAQIRLHTADGVEQTGCGGPLKVEISLGLGGKREVTEAFRGILKKVEMGDLDPEEIDEKTIESHLRFSQKPDLVIRAGGKRLSDFMIWQAAYSELYFTDVNWQELRKIDFLRAIRDCQRRARRFGR
ncbi:MAG: Tritrans,polycis-undecaprenyl-diphosphate synthase (GGDP specific) [Methanosaeta sp. PtaU1.Bin112]|nr:MAG: Tritrans,polycis-undecaprenyl-diphosphate synthase (GGDP specific) [Methanosaeta sp. PtaU1.Bin112]